MKNSRSRVRWLVLLAIGAGVFFAIQSSWFQSKNGQSRILSDQGETASSLPSLAAGTPTPAPISSGVKIYGGTSGAVLPSWKEAGSVDDRLERFPEAILVQEYDAPIEGSDLREHIQIIRVEMSTPLVRITDRRMISLAGKVTQIQDRLVMVADQTILQKPEGMSESELNRIVIQAGAKVLNALSPSGPYVIGFDTTDNPKKLDDVIRDIKKLSEGKVTADPDFIRFTDSL